MHRFVWIGKAFLAMQLPYGYGSTEAGSAMGGLAQLEREMRETGSMHLMSTDEKLK